MKQESIDIIIPIFNRNSKTEKCLEAIKNNTKNYNLIIIEKKQSASKNINEGLKQIKSKWFVIMDDDVIVGPKWLEKLKKHANDTIGQIQPKILLPFQRRMFCAELETNPLRHVGALELNSNAYSYVKEANLLTGACSLYNSKILSLGIKQDENYNKTQYNDLDFSLQIKKSGLKLLYCGESEVIHNHLFGFNSQNKENQLYFTNKWGKL